MPGYVIHMAVASRILGEKGISDSSFKDAFLLGNIIPDAMARDSKKESHFWDDDTFTRLNRIPNLEDFLSIYKHKLDNPFVLGYYTHLYMDNLFVREYWNEHFELLDKDMRPENSYELVSNIRLRSTGVIYSREKFLSDELYYGDYDRITPYIFDRYPIYIPSEILEEYPIRQIDNNTANPVLKRILVGLSELYNQRESLTRQTLKIFDLEHIYNLMDKVVSNVCDYMSQARQ